MKHLAISLCGIFLLSLTALAQQQDGARPARKPVAPDHQPILIPLNDERITAPLIKPGELAEQNEKLVAGAGLVMIEGATYIVVGETIVPLPGGGASGCLDKDAAATTARLARARAQYAQRLKKD